MPAVSEFDDAETVSLFETPAGKHLKVIKINNSALYGIRFHEGGELPESLSGAYTNVTLAVKDIKDYIADKQKAAKTKVTSKSKEG